MPRVDLHTHSVASHDGAITAKQYKRVIEAGLLDCVAITDHNRIDFAHALQSELGSEKVIIGEEIATKEGEIIGLFLTSVVLPHQSLADTIEAIKKQGGIVYIPHPFETVRKGISAVTLEKIRASIDILESANGRALFQNKGPQAHAWARLHQVPTFASSDAHHAKALGKTYTLLSEIPSKDTLIKLLSKSRKTYQRPSLSDVLAPKRAKIVKLVRRQKNA